jgi:hypothetical protein
MLINNIIMFHKLTTNNSLEIEVKELCLLKSNSVVVIALSVGMTSFRIFRIRANKGGLKVSVCFVFHLGGHWFRKRTVYLSVCSS